jgi:membrane-bound lytic murein transglycosylase MltF
MKQLLESMSKVVNIPTWLSGACLLSRLAIVALLFAVCTTDSSVASNENPTEKQDLLRFTEKWTGDFDGMRKRREIRALVTLNKLFYFLDGPVQRGEAYELLKEFETFVNKKLKTSTLRIEVIFIPVGRDQLLPRLVDGRGDIAAANLTITKERKELVDFSDAFLTNVSEVLVTGPVGPKISTVDDLSGKEVHVRRSASYFEHLVRLNASFRRQGLREVKIVAVDEYLEDEDILEMVNASLIPMTIVDSHKAQFWKGIFDHITVHENIAVNTGGQIAWAFRKGSPQLKAMINEFVAGHKKGTLLGNILYKRYLRENKWVRNSLADAEIKKFKDTVAYFKKYAGQYDFDWLLVAAQGYQESGLDQSKRSPVGAIGVMQLLPSTAADPNVNIPNIHVLENNIHAGTKYLRFLIDQYFSDTSVDKLNQHLFALAAYNAGPARVRELRKEAVKLGLNPDVWFDNVEIVAAKRIGRETVQYVRNIYKYYIAYRLVVDQLEKQRSSTATTPGPAKSRVSKCPNGPRVTQEQLTRTAVAHIRTNCQYELSTERAT